jgi:hypothetical protein
MLVAAILSAWLQYAADGEPHARVVVSDAVCPSLTVEGRAEPMHQRASKSPQFNDTVCDAAIPARARDVKVGDRELPVPAYEPQVVVVLGDTGCTLSGAIAQSCNDPAAWPFPQIARSIAALHPNLIVHVGDMLYREGPCRLLARCADSPYGDDDAAWFADFLTPAAPMLAASPIIAIRGNHEECRRNGTGWFRYLDPHPPAVCEDATEPYDVELGDLRIVAFDSSVAEDRKVDPIRAPLFRRQFTAARSMAMRPDPRPIRARSARRPRQVWFVTHRPPYINADERGAMGDALEPFDAVLAGHIHFFAAMNVASLPPLLINGEGGAKLTPNYAAFLGLAIGDLHVQGDVFGSSRFGFGVYKRAFSGWEISVREADGTELTRCTLANRSARC